ncbi:Deoxyhypusine synthase [Camellia lanceoleosa]|uniref:Deoxyhypusine synthase n=1 Tax=Camellia lanceoleosa TaxID=1840588 RepID=A0ACC0FPT8_9ERIC|nr:Deoxyhypusine synthase [Camellia lanceoleosa]
MGKSMENDVLALAHTAVFRESKNLEGSCIKIKGYDFNQGVNYSELIRSMVSTGFQASNLGDAIDIINQMIELHGKLLPQGGGSVGIRDSSPPWISLQWSYCVIIKLKQNDLDWRLSHEAPSQDCKEEEKETLYREPVKCKVFLGFTSNLISSLSEKPFAILLSIAWLFAIGHSTDLSSYVLIRLQIDVLVTTMGGIEEDLIKCLAPTYKGRSDIWLWSWAENWGSQESGIISGFLRRPHSPIQKNGDTVHVNQVMNQHGTTTVEAPRPPLPPRLESEPTVMHNHSTCGAHNGKTTTLVSTPSLTESIETLLSLNIPFMHTPLIPSFGSITIPSPSTPNESGPYTHSMRPSSTHSGLPYFVTEPSDSPTSQDHSRSLLPSQNELQIQSGPNSPSKPASEMLALAILEAPEILLSSVYTGLSLKRKALDEPLNFSPQPNSSNWSTSPGCSRV